MSEPLRRGRSIFARLLAVMVATALAVTLLVGGAVLVMLQPELDRAVGMMLDEVAELSAASDLDLAGARATGVRYGLSIRYQGPRGAWATDDWLEPPTAVLPRSAVPGRSYGCGRVCRVVLRPDGGTYLFHSWIYERASTQHNWIALILVLAIVLMTVVAHQVLRRVLFPIRTLRQGVAALAGGNLEVTVPRQSDDELGELADAFNQMVGRVREMVHSRDRLLQDVSHELRSPLTRMRVALALWEESEPRRRLERTLAEMEVLVQELLEMERLRAGGGLRRARHDLVEIVRDAVLAFGDRPPGVALGEALGEAPARREAEVDPDKVRSALNNLLENALRHALADSGPVRVSMRELAGGVEIQVEDDGPGIPEKDLPRIFEPFFRIDRSRSRRTGGYGLGLSVCRRIMEAHGGTVEARNRPRRGAMFTLKFPE